MDKLLKDWDFQELVEYSIQKIHLGLIEGGGKGMHSGVWETLITAMQWKDLQDKKEE